MKSLTYLLLICFFCHGYNSHAQGTTDFESAPGLVHLDLGKPARITWLDNYEAIFKSHVSQPAEVTLPFQVVENTCNDIRGQRCIYKSQIKKLTGYITWSKHPDNTRISQMVAKSISTFIYSDLKSFYPILGKGFKPSTISCNDYSWIPNGTTSAPPDQLEVVGMNSELMFTNRDTGVSENQAIAGAINLELKKNPKDELEITSIGAITGLRILLMAGDTVSWSLRQSNNELCQITFKSSRKGAIEVVNQLEAMAPTAEQIENPYIYGSDEMLFDSQNFLFLFEFQSWAKEFESIN